MPTNDEAKRAVQGECASLQQSQGGTSGDPGTKSQMQNILPEREGSAVVGPEDIDEYYGPMGVARGENRPRTF